MVRPWRCALRMQDQAAKALRNSFAAWRGVTPEHNRLVDTLLQSDCHVIVTMRTKTAYEVQQGGAKTRVVKWSQRCNEMAWSMSSRWFWICRWMGTSPAGPRTERGFLIEQYFCARRDHGAKNEELVAKRQGGRIQPAFE